MTIFHFSACALLSVALISCNQKASDEALICDQSPGFVADAQNPIEQMTVVDKCIHKWGYRLGRAPGSNSEIAAAVMGKCSLAIDWLRVLDSRAAKTGGNQLFPTEADWSSRIESYKQEALVRVVQGRAGQCSIRGNDQK